MTGWHGNESQWKWMEMWEIWPLAVFQTSERMVTKFRMGDKVGEPYLPTETQSVQNLNNNLR